MKTAMLSVGLIVAFLFTLNSCGLVESKKEAEEAAKTFHKHMKNQNHEAMINMIHSEGLKITPKEQWAQIFESMDGLGKIQKIEQDAGFNTNYNNGVTTVELNYTIEYKEKTLSEQIILVDEDGKFKVMGYFIK